MCDFFVTEAWGEWSRNIFPFRGIHRGCQIYLPVSCENPGNIFRQLRPFFRLAIIGSFQNC
jgi:hypothetical protein